MTSKKTAMSQGDQTGILDGLLSPIQINGLALANRFVMSPMTRNFSPGGVPSEPMAGYYRRRAEGGVGLVITEGIAIDHPAAIGSAGLGETAIPRLHGEDAHAKWRDIVAGVHQAGGRIAAQLWHQGPMRLDGTGPHPDAPSVRPSASLGRIGHCTLPRDAIERLSQPTRPASESEIAEVIAAYGRSAKLAVDAGFDAVEIHGAHGYLLDAFLWEGSNQRTDRWGGSLEARGRFANEAVACVRENIPQDMPLLFRWSQWKQQDYGAKLATHPEELERILGPLADAGVDVFDCSARRLTDPAFPDSPITLAGWAKRVTGKLTMAVGGVGLSGGLFDSVPGVEMAIDPDLLPIIERFQAGDFDLLGVGRALLQDPEWLVKTRAGLPTDPFLNERARSTIT